MKSGFRLAAVFQAVICLGAVAFLGWNILQTEHEYRAGISAYDRIAEIAGGTDGTEAVGNKGPGGIPAFSYRRLYDERGISRSNQTGPL